MGTVLVVPLLLLRRPPPRGQPPARGRRPGPRQRHGTGARRAPRDRRAGRLHPADPFGPPSGGPRAGAHLPHQSVDPGPEPRLARRDRAGCRPRLPPPDPVGGLGRRHRLRPRDTGHRLGGGPQRALLVLARRLPGRPRIPRPVRPRRARLRVGLDPGRGGRRCRGTPPRGVRRALLRCSRAARSGRAGSSGAKPVGSASSTPTGSPAWSSVSPSGSRSSWTIASCSGVQWPGPQPTGCSTPPRSGSSWRPSVT